MSCFGTWIYLFGPTAPGYSGCSVAFVEVLSISDFIFWLSPVWNVFLMLLFLYWVTLPVTVVELFLPIMNWSIILDTFMKLFFRTSSMSGECPSYVRPEM